MHGACDRMTVHGRRRRMGGDHGPAVTVPAALDFLEDAPTRASSWSASSPRSSTALATARSPARGPHRRIHGLREVVAMDEPPADALRSKKDSSMRVAINLVKDGDGAGLRVRRQHRRADGDRALRAEDAARHRPAGDRVAVADAQGRHHRARPGRQRRLHARAAAAVRGHGQRAGRRPSRTSSARRVGLLNIGEEDIKGNDVVKQAGELLQGDAASISTATSKATTSTRARRTSSCATASSATSR